MEALTETANRAKKLSWSMSIPNTTEELVEEPNIAARDDAGVSPHGPKLEPTGEENEVEKMIDDSRNGTSASFKHNPPVHEKPRTLPSRPRCEACDKEFNRLQDLRRHLETTKAHPGQKAFSCQCGKSYTRHDELLRHHKTASNCPSYVGQPAHEGVSVGMGEDVDMEVDLPPHAPMITYVSDDGYDTGSDEMEEDELAEDD
ncbi:hypothetical protein FA95DRAFT_965572 [Auriscalpium vulgare]|uniref:Uncharacterized protein n=1 Tax=Auriscalpium vulgare TaxID=40419 RepID=A0ACB8RYU3_9AGAM|nr:hypothetical protein FA95DRAFT_965572 [Auriscalpium vulgare]